MRLADLEAMRPASTTLRNLVRLLDAKLDSAAMVGVLAYEAEREGYAECVALLDEIARDERRHVNKLLVVLRGRLAEVPHGVGAMGE